MRRLWVAGVAMRGDGYPNAVNTVVLLTGTAELMVCDQADWLPAETRLWHLVRGPAWLRLRLMLRLVMGGLAQAVRLCVRIQREDAAYLPYPAPLTLWWLSWVPRRWRPRCIADAYISLWDSMFRDRGGGDVSGLASRLLRWFEARSLRAASLVLVDTEANRQQMVVDFKLSAGDVRSIPLAINEYLFAPSAGSPTYAGRPLRVLFVGTLVPLHGIDIVLDVAAELLKEAGVEFRLIGDGQQSPLVEAFVRDDCPARFTWVRDWMPLAGIAREIEESDVCLGVFGGNGKAARVLPFKLYYAMAAGKAIVTQGGYSLPDGLPPLPAVLVEGADRKQVVRDVVTAIRMLLDSPTDRVALGEAAGHYFADHLSSNALCAAWREVLSAINNRANS